MLAEIVTSKAPIAADAWTYIDEITHRTMNDYTVVLASLEFAATRVSDPSSQTVLQDVAKHLRVRAEAHRMLRPPRGAGIRQLDDDLTELCAALSTTLLVERSIELTLFCEPVSLEARRAWQICLIISELVMNAVRHAFVDRPGGAVNVEVRSDGRFVRCRVADNGSATIAPSPGGGTTIVDALVVDLGGRVARKYAQTGSAICVRIPFVSEKGFAARAIP